MSDGDKTVIDGYEVEMMDCDGSLCCFVTSKRHRASASLAALEAEGVLTPYNPDGADHPVKPPTIERIAEWALDHGY